MLRNGVSLIKAFRALVLGNLVSDGAVADVEVRDQPLPIPSAPSAAMLAAQPSAAAVRAVPATSASSSQFERPLIILSAPRSGSTLLFETLAKAPGLFTIGGESHRAIESIPGLHPSARNYDSNRLAAADATAAVITAVRQNFSQGLRDRAGNAPLPRVPVRLLEKTPKNALRLPFLRQVFADGHFIYLYREPREVLASMIEAWRSGRFRTYPTLPGWSGPPWSLLLIPGWRDLEGRPLEEVVARQWATTTDMLLDDLQMLPVEKLSRVRYDALVKQPQVEIDRLCGELGLDWDTALGELALSRHTISRPDPDKWKQHEDVLRKVLPMVEDTRARAERFVAG